MDTSTGLSAALDRPQFGSLRHAVSSRTVRYTFSGSVREFTGMACSSCGATLPERALRCPECGSPVTDTDDGRDPEAAAPEGNPGTRSELNADKTGGFQQNGPSQEPSAEEERPQQPTEETRTTQFDQDESATTAQHSASAEYGPQQTGGRSLTDQLDATLLVSGLSYGAGAYVASYVITGLLVAAAAGGIDLDVSLSTSDAAPGIVVVFGWLLYSAHTVDVGVVGGESVNLLETVYTALDGSLLPKFVVYVAPLLVLFVVATVLVSRTKPTDSTGPVGGVIAGGSVTLGYAVLTIAGTVVLFTYSPPDGGATVRPVFGLGTLLMGVVSPLVTGCIAGYLSGQ